MHRYIRQYWGTCRARRATANPALPCTALGSRFSAKHVGSIGTDRNKTIKSNFKPAMERWWITPHPLRPPQSSPGWSKRTEATARTSRLKLFDWLEIASLPLSQCTSLLVYSRISINLTQTISDARAHRRFCASPEINEYWVVGHFCDIVETQSIFGNVSDNFNVAKK